MAALSGMLASSFVWRLRSIATFLHRHHPRSADERLAALVQRIQRAVPRMRARPASGRYAGDLTIRELHSNPGLAEQIANFADSEFREWVLPPYILLYASSDTAITLLSIRHEREASY